MVWILQCGYTMETLSTLSTVPLWGESTGYPVDSPHKGQVMYSIDIFFVVGLTKIKRFHL